MLLLVVLLLNGEWRLISYSVSLFSQDCSRRWAKRRKVTLTKDNTKVNCLQLKQKRKPEKRHTCELIYKRPADISESWGWSRTLEYLGNPGYLRSIVLKLRTWTVDCLIPQVIVWSRVRAYERRNSALFTDDKARMTVLYVVNSTIIWFGRDKSLNDSFSYAIHCSKGFPDPTVNIP